METISEKCLTMVFGNKNTKYLKFHTDDDFPEDYEWLEMHNHVVNLSGFGFASEWVDWVDDNKSKAYIKGGKLYVEVYGLPDHINHKAVLKYFKRQLEHSLEIGYGEFFEGEPGCPICVVVEYNGREVIV